MHGHAPIGRHARSLCEWLEQAGPQGSNAMCQRFQNIAYKDMMRIVRTAVWDGLIEKSIGPDQNRGHPVYTVARNWQAIAAKRTRREGVKVEKIDCTEPMPQSIWARVGSVFQMGAM